MLIFIKIEAGGAASGFFFIYNGKVWILFVQQQPGVSQLQHIFQGCRSQSRFDVLVQECKRLDLSKKARNNIIIVREKAQAVCGRCCWALPTDRFRS
ncbi:hypothetical protein MHB50_12700 [Siminovitchia sp. FSL H7-0308]|uniref:Uncharacterized protein n=1 Tax=Siminovitchia thermophila TaxID=1245522 RepID=A0ABS2RDZ7_9BACI|nr:hypothetical protein [Siminovitchia thermophila]MBM7717088.1 hypothetical protein [Siminovitchia thermophila]